MFTRSSTDLPPDAVGTVSGAADPAEGGAAILELLSRVTPHVGAALCVWHPFAERHRTLVSIGYSQEVLDYLNGGFVRLDPAYRRMRTEESRTMRWHDWDFDYRETYSAQSVFGPAGYREGLTACLSTPDGRYTGALHVSSDSPEHPSDAARETTELLRPVLAWLCRLAGDIDWLASAVPQGSHALALTADDRAVTLGDRGPGPYLAEGTPLRSLAATLARTGAVQDRFLWRDADGGWHRVQVAPFDGGVMIAERSTEVPYGLTPRELEVLALVTQGLSNREIAELLVVTPRTVATHVEHLLGKLDAGTRAELAARAVREGLQPQPFPAAYRNSGISASACGAGLAAATS